MEDQKPDIVEITDIEKSAIGEVCDLITASLAKTFSEKLGSDVGMNPSSVEAGELAQIPSIISAPVLLLQLSFSSALEGQLFLFLGGEGLPGIFDIAIPEDAKEVGADDEAILEGLNELVNTAVYEAMENFAESMGHTINCSIVDTVIMQDESGFDSIGFLYPEGKLLYVTTELSLPNGIVSTGYFMPLGLSRQIIELLLNEQPDQQPDMENADFESAESTYIDDEQEGNGRPLSFDVGLEDFEEEQSPIVQDLQAAHFSQIQEGNGNIGSNNISLLLDVALDASIELGKTQMTIEDILKLGRGSVIELDKLASEPVEFLVNGKVIARGEVVVIDDNFGIRITEILSPKARLENI